MPRTHTPLSTVVRDDDFLLCRAQVAKRLGCHPNNAWGVVFRWASLRAGLRVLRVRPGSRGVLKLVRGDLMDWIHVHSRVGEETAVGSVEHARLVRELGEHWAAEIAAAAAGTVPSARSA